MAELSARREVKPRAGGPDMSTRDLFRLDGRTIVITGGGGSMGLQIASSVLETGGDVICLDRAANPLPDLWTRAQTLAQTHGTKIWYHVCDMGSTDDDAAFKLDTVFAHALQQSRFPLRGMVACAGISGGGPTETYPLDTARSILSTNLIGTLAAVQSCVRAMHAQAVATGSIVLIASMSAHGANKGVNTTAYNMSKAGVVQLARSLAAEYGSSATMTPGLRVNSISPGYTRTRMTEQTLTRPGIEEAWVQGNMLCRLAEADEMRGPAMFLLADASSYVTGADLRVDGGHTAW